MGTRQELGLGLLMICLALPALLGGASERPPASSVLACLSPIQIETSDGLAFLECRLPTSGEGFDNWLPGCSLVETPRAGDRIVCEHGQNSGCLCRRAAMTGHHRLLVGFGIDPNTASSTDLQALPGIGPSLAERIVLHRSGDGGFTSADDLERVRGIGPRTVERFRGYLRFDAPLPRGPLD